MAVIVREKVKGSGEWWVFINHNNKRRSKKIGSKVAANRVKRDVERGLANGDLGLEQKKEVPTLGEYGRELIDSETIEWSDNTRSNYEKLFKKHLEPHPIARLPLNKIKRSDVVRWIDGLKETLATGSVRTVVAMASGFFQYAFDRDIVKANPMARPGKLIGGSQKKEKGSALDPGEGKVYSPEEAAQVIENSKTLGIRGHAFVVLALGTGMRLGEMLGLEWGRIDFSERHALVSVSWDYKHKELVPPKNGKPRYVNLSRYVVEVLQALHEETSRPGPGDPVFITRGGSRLPDTVIRRQFYTIRPEGSDVTIHGLRHTYATLRLVARHSPVDVSKQLGHASIAFTLEKYVHWIPNQYKHEVDDLDGLFLRTPAAPEAVKPLPH